MGRLDKTFSSTKKELSSYEIVEKWIGGNSTITPTKKHIADWFVEHYKVVYGKDMLGFNQFHFYKVMNKLCDNYKLSNLEFCKSVVRWRKESEKPIDVSSLNTNWLMEKLNTTKSSPLPKVKTKFTYREEPSVSNIASNFKYREEPNNISTVKTDFKYRE